MAVSSCSPHSLLLKCGSNVSFIIIVLTIHSYFKFNTALKYVIYKANVFWVRTFSGNMKERIPSGGWKRCGSSAMLIWSCSCRDTCSRGCHFLCLFSLGGSCSDLMELGGGGWQHGVKGSLDVCNNYCYWVWCNRSLINVVL